MARSFFRFLVRHPVIVLTITAIFSVTLTAVGFGVTKYGIDYMLDSFRDPELGFEARGTELSGRRLQMNEFTKAVESGQFTKRPNTTANSSRKRRAIDIDYDCPTSFNRDFIYSSTQVVASSTLSNKNLFTVDNMRELCYMTDTIIDVNAKDQSVLCPNYVFSVADIIAERYNKSCSSISQTDVDDMLRLMKLCYNIINPVINECLDLDNLVMLANLRYFFLTNEFVEGLKDDESPVLSKTMLFSWRSLDHELYNYFDSQRRVGSLRVDGIYDIGASDLFSDYMIKDLIFLAIGLAVIMLIMFLYVKSFLITIGTILSIVFAFGVSYFIYHYIFQLTFFPFLNILALLVLIAVGADNVYVYCDAWQSAKTEYLSQKPDTGKDNPAFNAGEVDLQETQLPSKSNQASDLELNAAESSCSFETMLADHIMPNAFGHAIRSILITSLTTAFAFASNFASKIVVVRCFGLFGMTCILVNYLFMIIWIAPFVVCMEIIDKKRGSGCKCGSDNSGSFLRKVADRWTLITENFFCQFLPFLVTKLHILWIILFIGIGVGGVIVSFVTPGLQRPSSIDMQMFPDNNLITKFSIVSEGFRYIDDQQNPIQYITFIWGLSDRDNSNHLNPNSNAKLELVPFSLSSKDEQRSLTDFCRTLRNQPWISTPREEKCFMDAYYDHIKANCTNESNPECCGIQDPVNEETLNKCFKYFASIIDTEDTYLGDPYFDTQSHSLVAFTYDVTAPLNSTLFEETRDFVNMIDDFTAENSGSLENGYPNGNFAMYDLQENLATGMWTALWISLLLSVFIILVTTMNVLISLYAVISIGMAIFTTIGTLVLMGWELNIVESAIMTLAVGLSIDFTIHYGVAYVHSKRSSSSDRINESFERVGSSVSMAALTTFLAGALIMPARILAYQQLGIFLMLVMTIAWVFSTFLFQAICALIGPKGDFLQFKICKQKVDNGSGETDTDINDDKVVSNGSYNIHENGKEEISDGMDIIDKNEEAIRSNKSAKINGNVQTIVSNGNTIAAVNDANNGAVVSRF